MHCKISTQTRLLSDLHGSKSSLRKHTTRVPNGFVQSRRLLAPYEPPRERNRFLSAKTKAAQISCATVTAQLISAFVFAAHV